MGKPVAGTCYVKIDGEQLEVSGDLECPLSEVKRETVMAINGSAGYKETAQEPYVKVTAIRGRKFPREKIVAGTDMTVTAEFSNGEVYTLQGAWLQGEPTAKADDGTAALEFGGMKGQWA